MLHPPPWFEALFGWRVLFGGDVTPTSMIWGFIWLVVMLHPPPWFEALFGWWWCYTHLHDLRLYLVGVSCLVVMLHPPPWFEALFGWWWCYTHLHDLRLYLVGGDVTPTSMIWGFIWLVVMLHPPPWFEALFGWWWCYTHLHEIWGFIWLACPVWWWCYTHLHDLRLYLVGVSCLVVMLHPPPWFEALFGWWWCYTHLHDLRLYLVGMSCLGGDVTPTSMIWGFIWLVVMLHPPPWFEALFGWWWCYTHLHDLRLFLVGMSCLGGDVTPTSMIWGFIWLVVMLHPPPWFEALFGCHVVHCCDNIWEHYCEYSKSIIQLHTHTHTCIYIYSREPFLFNIAV